MTSATSATSEGAQGIFSKITFLKSVRSNEKGEVCHSFVVEIFTKSLYRGGVTVLRINPIKATLAIVQFFLAILIKSGHLRRIAQLSS